MIIAAPAMMRPELVEGRLDGLVTKSARMMIDFIDFPLSTYARTCDLHRADGWGRDRWLQLDGAASDENIFTDEDANARAGDPVVIHLCRSSRTQITKWARPGRARDPRGASGSDRSNQARPARPAWRGLGCARVRLRPARPCAFALPLG